MDINIHFHGTNQQSLIDAVNVLAEAVKTLAAARPVSEELKQAVALVVAGANFNDGLIPDEAVAKS